MADAPDNDIISAEWAVRDQARPRGRRSRGGPHLRPRRTATPPFDHVGLLRRARRNARLSQREMADAIGVSKSAYARAELNDGTVSLPLLLATLETGGISLIAVDDDGEILTMRNDELTDRGQRKLPAHLLAWVAGHRDARPEHWRAGGRLNAPVRWEFRSARRRAPRLPIYHPGPEDVTIARRNEARPIPQPRVPKSGDEPLTCFCPPSCLQGLAPCPDDCPCRCETEAFPPAG